MQTNENIESITGDPKKAINKLAIPTILSILLMFLNNLIDSFWVSGISTDALAALGFISPLYLVIIGIGSGIGAGGNSLISRYIGASHFNDAENAVIHTIILTVIISIIILIIGIFFLDDILMLVGAASSMDLSMQYLTPMILCPFVLIFSNFFTNTLHAEGNSKIPTIMLILTNVLNLLI